MHHDDSDLAVIVISQQFELIDNVGNIVADFASSNAFAAFPGLIFHNLNAAGIADGVLYWSTDAAGPATAELVALVGPRPVGASATSARVVLRGDTSGQSTAQLTAPAATGLSNGQVFVQRTGPTLSVASMNARDDTSISAAIQLVAQTGVVTAFVIADTIALQPTTAVNLNSRGAYLLTDLQYNRGSINTGLTAVAVAVVTPIVVVGCVIGDRIDISAILGCLQGAGVAGPTFAVAQIQITDAAATVTILPQRAVMQTPNLSTNFFFTVPVDAVYNVVVAGNVTIDLIAFSTAGATYTATANDSSITARRYSTR